MKDSSLPQSRFRGVAAIEAQPSLVLMADLKIPQTEGLFLESPLPMPPARSASRTRLGALPFSGMADLVWQLVAPA
jgi:hypothetical protein